MNLNACKKPQEIFLEQAKEINNIAVTPNEISVLSILSMVEDKIKRDGILLSSTCDSHAHI